MALRHGKYRQAVKDQGKDVHGAYLPFKDKHLRSQVPSCAFTFSRTSNQFRSSRRPGPNHTPRMQMDLLHQQKGAGRGTPSLLAPNCRPSLLLKFILAPAICSYLMIAFLTASMSERQDTKTVISSAYKETFARWSPTKGIPRRAGFSPPIPKSLKQGLQSEEIEKRKQKTTLTDRLLDNERPRTLPVHLHHCPRAVIQHDNLSVELRLESGGLQNHRQELMVHPVEGLGLI